MRAIVSETVAKFAAEDKGAIDARYTAVKFRGKVYVATPRHLDAINLAFAGMTHLQKRTVSNWIADGKETMLFGSAKVTALSGNGSKNIRPHEC